MSSHYQIIYADLTEDEPEAVTLPRLPNLDLYDASIKISILFRMYKRSHIRGNRILMLFYLSQVGKWIITYNLSLKDAGLSSYYYKVAQRIYLLFEFDEAQIMRTKNMTLRDVRNISRRELDDLIEFT